MRLPLTATLAIFLLLALRVDGKGVGIVRGIIDIAVKPVINWHPWSEKTEAVPLPTWDGYMRSDAQDWNAKPIKNYMEVRRAGGPAGDIHWEVSGWGKWIRAGNGRMFYQLLRRNCLVVAGFGVRNPEPDQELFPHDIDSLGDEERELYLSHVAFDLLPGFGGPRGRLPTCVADSMAQAAYFLDGLSARWEVDGDVAESQLKGLTKDGLERHIGRLFEGYRRRGDWGPPGVGESADGAALHAPPIGPHEVALPFTTEQGLVCVREPFHLLRAKRTTRWHTLMWGPYIDADHGHSFFLRLFQECAPKYHPRNREFDYHFEAGNPYAVAQARFDLNNPFLDRSWLPKLTGAWQSGSCIKEAARKTAEPYGPAFLHCNPFGFTKKAGGPQRRSAPPEQPGQPEEPEDALDEDWVVVWGAGRDDGLDWDEFEVLVRNLNGLDGSGLENVTARAELPPSYAEELEEEERPRLFIHGAGTDRHLA